MNEVKKVRCGDRRPLTVRERFAALALARLLAKPNTSEASELVEQFADHKTVEACRRNAAKGMARHAVMYADALIEALER